MTTKIKAKIFDASGVKGSDFDLDSDVFSKTRSSVVYDAVRHQLLKRRAGTHSCLSKGVMKGGGKKPWKQKGTGRARAGSNTSPVWVGGAVAHGPKPRSYENRTMKRTLKQSLVTVLREKAVSGSLYCFENLQVSKTKEFTAVLKNIDLTAKKVLFIVDANSAAEMANVKAARNVAGVKVISSTGLNTYDVLNSDAVIVSKGLLQSVQENIKQNAA